MALTMEKAEGSSQKKLRGPILFGPLFIIGASFRPGFAPTGFPFWFLLWRFHIDTSVTSLNGSGMCGIGLELVILFVSCLFIAQNPFFHDCESTASAAPLASIAGEHMERIAPPTSFHDVTSSPQNRQLRLAPTCFPAS
jgi:hypothetical protein